MNYHRNANYCNHIARPTIQGRTMWRTDGSVFGPNRLPALGLILGLLIALVATKPGSCFAQDYVPDQVVVNLNPGADIEDVNQRWGTTTIDSFEDGIVHLVNAAGLGDIPTLALQMSGDPDVLEAEPNFREDTPEGIRYMLVVAIGGDLVDYEDQSLTSRIELAAAHQHTRGLGVKVAVLDSGIDPTHDLFQGRIAPGGYDFVDEDTEPWEEANGIDDDGDDTIDEGYGHGTMVAGLVLLVAPDAYILPIRVLDDEGRSDIYRITRAIRHAREQGADVLNLSFGSPGSSSTMQTEMGLANDDQIVIVAGAGNESREEPAFYPGESSKTLMVTALDSVDVKAPFADWNQKVFVSAPGDGVRSAYPGNGWGLASGCSFATPLVSGVAALIRAVRPGWTGENVEDQVESAVDPIYSIPGNSPYVDKLGSGRINARLAVEGLITSDVGNAPSSTPPLVASPNPTHGSVWFTRAAADGSLRDLQVVDATGRQVRLLSGADGPIQWDGRDDHGRPVPSGLYLYSLSGDSERRKLVVIR